MKTQQQKSTFACIRSLFIALFFLTNNIIYAQKSGATNSLLWKIEGKGLTKPSYLFGTVHMICEDKFVMLPKVKNALGQTEQSYLEIDLSSPDFTAQAMKFMKSDKTISSQISKEDFAYADSIVTAKVKVSLKKLDSIKPAMIMAYLMQASFPCKVKSFESEIIKETTAAHKKVSGLSTIEEQYSFLDKIFSANELAPYLKQYGDVEMQKIASSIAEAYQKEDTGLIDNLLLEFSTTNPEGYRQLLPVRNKLWLDKMPEIMKSKPTFFAVGCGHLSGKEGLINLLRDKGYKVSPVY